MAVFRQEYLRNGGLNGDLGAPITQELDRGGTNKIQYFENGHIYWNGSQAIAYRTGQAGSSSPPNSTPNQTSDPNGFNPAEFRLSIGVSPGIKLRTDTYLNAPYEGVTNQTEFLFDGWKYGEAVQDRTIANGQMDSLWFHVKGTNYWIPSAFMIGYPPGYQPPVSSGSGKPIFNLDSEANSSNGNWIFLNNDSSGSNKGQRIEQIKKQILALENQMKAIQGDIVTIKGRLFTQNYPQQILDLNNQIRTKEAEIKDKNNQADQLSNSWNPLDWLKANTLRQEAGNLKYEILPQIQANRDRVQKEYNALTANLNKLYNNQESVKETLEPLRQELDKLQKELERTEFIHPLPGYPITSDYGDPHSSTGIHLGIDFGTNGTTPEIKAAARGNVIWAGWKNGGFGNLVILDHGNGVKTLYMHLSTVSSALIVGQEIPRGTGIGNAGSTGNSTGIHLH